MKKIKNSLAFGLAVMFLMVSLSVTAFAATTYDPVDMGTPTFVYGSVVPTYTAVNSATNAAGKSENGTFVNDGIFENGWYHKQINTGGNTYDNNYHQYTFDTSSVFGDGYKIKEGDAIYLSFYYKSASSFDFNGTTYTGKSSPNINIKLGGNNAKGSQMYNLNKYDSQKRLTPSTFAVADDEWHKLQYCIRVTSANAALADVVVAGKLKITIDFPTTAEAYDIRFADFTIGKFNLDDTKIYTDMLYSRVVEYLCRVLESTTSDIKYFSTDGYIIPTTIDEGENSKKTEYVVTTTSDAPVVKASNSANASFASSVCMITDYTNNNGVLSLNAYAPAYDKTKGSDYKVTYVTVKDFEKLPNVANNVAVRTAEYSNDKYFETFNLTMQKEYKVFEPSIVHHNYGVGNNGYKNVYSKFNGDNVDAQKLQDDANFSSAYVMQLIKNSEAGLATLSDDNHYYEFRYDTDGYADKGDLIMYSMYIKVDSPSGDTANLYPSFKFSAALSPTSTESNIKVYSGTNSSYVLIDEYPKSFAPGSGWKKLIFQANANGNEVNYIRMGVAIAGTRDYIISVAEPRCAILKFASEKMPEVEKYVNNVRKTKGSYNATKADVIGVSANGIFIAPDENNSFDIPERAITSGDVKVVSSYGYIPFKLTKDEKTGKYNIIAYPITYNPLITNTTQTVFNRTVTAYNYTDGTSSETFDYEESLVNPVKSVNTNTNSSTNSRKISNEPLSTIIINPTDGFKMKIGFKKDNASVENSNGVISGDEGSDYTIDVSGSYFLNTDKLILAVYENGKIIGTNSQSFVNGNASTTVENVVNTENNVTFRAFVWDMRNNKCMPITDSIDIGDSEIGFFFPVSVER